MRFNSTQLDRPGESGRAVNPASPGNRLRALIFHLVIGCGVQFGNCAYWGAYAQETTNSAAVSAASPDADRPKNEVVAEDESSPIQEGDELGRQTLLRRRSHRQMFRAYSDTQYLYTSNVLLADGEFIQVGDDSVFLEDVGASFSPALIEPLVSSLYYNHNLTRFNSFSEFDFDADTAGLHLGLPVADLFTLYGDFSATRYYYREHGHEFYKFYNTELGIGREQRLSRRASLDFGYQLDWRPSSPSELNRIDNAVYLGANFALVDKLTAQFYYRIRVREYYQDSHTDLDQILNLTLVYSFNDYISARISATYGLNSSSESVRDYNVYNAGAGLNLNIKF